MAEWRMTVRCRRAVRNFIWVGLALPLFACAEVQVGVELAKRANRALDANLARAEPLSPKAQQNSAVSPYLKPAPEVFEATGIAQWDGKRTLQGIWVAHPLATTARRVRIFNSENDQAVDGALFKRDAAVTGASVLISSEAAQRLGIAPGGSAELRIVAVSPVPRNEVAEQPAASEVAEDQTDKPVESPAAQTGETPAADADETVVSVITPAAKPEETEDAAPAPSEPEVRVLRPNSADVSAEAEGTTLAQPVTRVAPQPKPAVRETPEAETAQAAATVQGEGTTDRSEPAQSPSDTGGEFKWESAAADTAAQPEPAKKAEPKPQKPKQAAASKLRQPFVQAGVFGVSENAKRLIRRLKQRGIPAQGKNVSSNGRTLTRVLAGPFSSIAARNRAQAAIRKMGMSDAVPVRR